MQDARQLDGGEEATVYRLDSGAGTVVLHISPAWRSHDELAWVHRLIQHVKPHVPEAVAPLGAPGETIIEHEWQCAALYPFVEGTPLDREDPRQREHAAQCLAAIHRATRTGFDAPRPPAPFSAPPSTPQCSRRSGPGRLVGIERGRLSGASPDPRGLLPWQPDLP